MLSEWIKDLLRMNRRKDESKTADTHIWCRCMQEQSRLIQWINDEVIHSESFLFSGPFYAHYFIVHEKRN